MTSPIRVLVVDDTAIYRKIVSDILRELPGVEVVGTAVNGQIALEKIRELKPDAVTLDVEMPVLNGVEVLRELRRERNSIQAIMLSAFTSEGAEATTQALRLGALDFVLKPTGDSPAESNAWLRARLSERIGALIASRAAGAAPTSSAPRVDPPVSRRVVVPMAAVGTTRPEIVVLGISTGGPEALNKLLPQLPADLAAPILLVQHMPPLFTKSLADDLNQRCKLNVFEAVDGHIARPGEVIIAPGGKQMNVEKSEWGPVIRITDDPPENSCRPAVDYLFRAAAHHYGQAVLAIVMTGMGNDGTLGCRLLKRRGAQIMAQNKESCVVFGMPSLLVEEGLADVVGPIGEIARETIERVGQGVPA